METVQQLVRLTRPWEVGHNLHKPIVELDNVTVNLRGVTALEAVSFSLRRGERVAVIGPNGAGKSTLFNLISGLLSPSQGQVHIHGTEPDEHVCIAYVPQRNQVDWQFPVTVADVVMMGRAGKLGLFRWPGHHDRAVVSEALELVGMADLATRQIGELSGGQQQRVFIARALAQETALLLMDEPLNGLDIRSQEGIFDILDQLRARQVTVMLSTHDLNQAAEQFDRLMLLNQRLIAFGPAEAVFQPDILSQTYGGQMQLLPTAEGMVAISH